MKNPFKNRSEATTCQFTFDAQLIATTVLFAAFTALTVASGCETSQTSSGRTGQSYEYNRNMENGSPKYPTNPPAEGITYVEGPVGNPIPPSDGFSPYGVSQDNFNLADILGGFGADSFGGSILSENPAFDGSRLQDPVVFDAFANGQPRLLPAPSPVGEELWIITRPDEDAIARDTHHSPLDLREQLAEYSPEQLRMAVLGSDDDRWTTTIGNPLDHIDPCGGIVGIVEDRYVPHTGGTPVPPRFSFLPVPLHHTDVRASVSGFVATVDVEQAFHNPYNHTIEAIYVFPLPESAAVNEFVMTVGNRRIRGIVRDRDEAEAIYQQAKSQGYVASIMHQNRPNIFTQKVANLEPGKRIDVSIRYFNTLPYKDGWYELAFPMTIGPRFNPPNSDSGSPLPRGEGLGVRADRSSQRTSPSIPYRRPHQRSGHDISLAVRIDAGVPIEALKSTSHSIQTNTHRDTAATVRLTAHDTIPNKDFVLRWKVAGDDVRTAMLAQPDSPGSDTGHFAMMLYPPDNISRIQRRPIELVFVLDTSGSMNGQPLRIAKQAVERTLKKMDDDDTFQILRFSDNVSSLGNQPLRRSSRSRRNAERYLDNLSANGGTHMRQGIEAAINLPMSGDRDRYIVFLTDGFIGNESEVLNVLANGIRRYQEESGSIRVFSFGIGESPNRFLMERMATMGDGAVAYVNNMNDSPTEIMDAFIERIAHPAFENVVVDFGNMQVSEVYPSRLRDLYVGRPIVVSGRYRGHTDNNTIRVTGDVGGTRQTLTTWMQPDDHPGIAPVWARTKIADLSNHLMAANSSHNARVFERDIRTTALQYGLVSAYTSFIAVDGSGVTAGNRGTTVHVPAEVPQGVDYDSIVIE